MRTRRLGTTGIDVSPLCLGTMMLSPEGNPDQAECVRIIHAALDGGINFVDTADVYAYGESEQVVGKALASGKRDRVVLATKVHNPMSADPNQRGNSRRWIREAVDDSLRRLQTDWIDLYQVHRPDPDMDVAETLSVLTDLVREGKIRYFGSSTFPAEMIVEAQWTAEKRCLEHFVTEQPPYSILARGIEGNVLPVCHDYGLGVLTWSPLGSGWLSGRFRKGSELPVTHRSSNMNADMFDMTLSHNQAKLEAVDRLAALAEASDIRLLELAIAFVLEHPDVTSAIIGPRTADQLEDLLGASRVELDQGILDQIDDIVPAGTNIDPDDAGWQHPRLESTWHRRRSMQNRGPGLCFAAEPGAQIREAVRG